MAPNATISLSRTVAFAQLFVRNAPTAINLNNDPALGIADWVRGVMMAPPFAWRWNRQTTTLTLQQGQQDYPVNLSGFGWLEKASIVDSNNNVHALEVQLNLDEESTQNQPTAIAARLDDGNENITFRVLPAPDQAYVVNISYQQAPAPFSSLNSTWAPVPDYLSYIYQQGFLARVYEYMLDERYIPALQMFLRMLISANTGLTATQVDIFMADFLNSRRDMAQQMAQIQSGK